MDTHPGLWVFCVCGWNISGVCMERSMVPTGYLFVSRGNGYFCMGFLGKLIFNHIKIIKSCIGDFIIGFT